MREVSPAALRELDHMPRTCGLAAATAACIYQPSLPGQRLRTVGRWRPVCRRCIPTRPAPADCRVCRWRFCVTQTVAPMAFRALDWHLRADW